MRVIMGFVLALRKTGYSLENKEMLCGHLVSAIKLPRVLDFHPPGNIFIHSYFFILSGGYDGYTLCYIV